MRLVTRTLFAEPLTARAFAPFGHVIEADPSTAEDIGDGYVTRHHALAAMEMAGGAPILSIHHARPRPLVAQMLERHVDGTEALMPLDGRDWLALVAEDAEGLPGMGRLRLFRCRGDQGLQYGRGVWHHPLIALGERQSFLVADREDAAANTEVADLPEIVAMVP